MEPLNANTWQGNQNNSGYTPQAGPSNYNSGYKPAPYKKFGKKPNYKPNNQNPGYNSNATLAVKVPMVQIGNETVKIAKTRNRRECYLKNK
jgi:hypothetical protein